MFYEIALRWMPPDLTDDKSTSVQVMAWCRQATSHYLSNVDPDLCRQIASLGLNELCMCHNSRSVIPNPPYLACCGKACSSSSDMASGLQHRARLLRWGWSKGWMNGLLPSTGDREESWSNMLSPVTPDIRTNSKNLNDSRLVLQLSLPNPLKPGVKLRMKM